MRASLENGLIKTKLLTSNQKPSPNADISMVNSTRNSRISSSILNICRLPFLKKLSLFILRTRLNAGMTVEAAMVFPLFIVFLLQIASYIEIIRLHNNIQLAMCIRGNEFALYGNGLYTEETKGIAREVLTEAYMKNAIIEYAGTDYLDDSPVKHGHKGIQIWESNMARDSDILDIELTYEVAPFILLIGFKPFRMGNRYYVHLWNGYELTEKEDETSEEEEVYVTEYGEVWHTTDKCTHLNLSVREISKDDVDEERNMYGAKYYPCEKCVSKKEGDVLLITDEGTRYHTSSECPGLKRTVRAITISEAEEKGYRPCSRCGGLVN